jgi:hypothetical protein
VVAGGCHDRPQSLVARGPQRRDPLGLRDLPDRALVITEKVKGPGPITGAYRKVLSLDEVGVGLDAIAGDGGTHCRNQVRR